MAMIYPHPRTILIDDCLSANLLKFTDVIQFQLMLMVTYYWLYNQISLCYFRMFMLIELIFDL